MFQKRQISWYIASQYGLGTWEVSLIVKGVLAIGLPRRKAFISNFKTDILYFWTMHPFLQWLNQMYSVCLIDYKTGL